MAAFLLAGCGSSSGGGTTAASTPPPPASSPAPKLAVAHHRLQPACSRRAREVLRRATSVEPSAVTVSPFKASNKAAACRLQAGDAHVVVMLDSAPQPYVRMDREQVEFWQNVEWSDQAAKAAPYPMTSLGLGGYWFPLQSRLLTTDGVRLVTIKVKSAGSAGSTASKSLAARLAQIYLGPPVKPPGY
jgi:hypothetical protein